MELRPIKINNPPTARRNAEEKKQTSRLRLAVSEQDLATLKISTVMKAGK